MIAFLMLNISKTVKDIKLKFCMCVCGTEVFKKRHLIFKEFDLKKLGGPIYIQFKLKIGTTAIVVMPHAFSLQPYQFHLYQWPFTESRL